MLSTGSGHGVCNEEEGYFKSFSDGEGGSTPWATSADAYCIEAAYLSGKQKSTDALDDLYDECWSITTGGTPY